MRTIVADTGPLNYLVLIGDVHILPALFGTVFVPRIVQAELNHPEAPLPVREWVAPQPPWLVVRPDVTVEDDELRSLDDGERGAINLAFAMSADLVLMDDRAGVAVARHKGLAVTGTIGLLTVAAERGLLELTDAFERLRETSFRCRPELLDALLARHKVR